MLSTSVTFLRMCMRMLNTSALTENCMCGCKRGGQRNTFGLWRRAPAELGQEGESERDTPVGSAVRGEEGWSCSPCSKDCVWILYPTVSGLNT